MEPAVPNNLNNQIANCAGIGTASVPCPVGVGPPAVPPAGVLSASVTIASVAFGSVPIASPVREQGLFITNAWKSGVAIPLEALDAAGAVIPGLTTFANPLGGAGTFPTGVTVTSNDATAHTALFLVDAWTGQVAQQAVSNAAGLVIHEFNALSTNTTTGFTNVCGTGAQSCNDNLTGLGTDGDPWVIVMTFDGVAPAALPSVTVSAAATNPNAALPAPITTVITPQAAVYTAGGTGYADLATPTAPAGLITVGAANYFTDGNSVKIDGLAPGVATTATALGGLTQATWPNATSFIYAVDSAQAGAATTTEQGSGLFAYNAALTTEVPVSAAAGANNYITFQNPVAVVQGLGAGAGAGHPYLYVINQAGGIYRVDITGSSEQTPVGGFQEANNVLPLLSQSGTALSPGTAKVLGTAQLAGGQFLIGDPGNNRIAMVDATAGNTATITTWATCPGCTGLFVSGTSAYATSTSGQIYYLSAQGATAVSLGFALGTAADGQIGQISSFTPASTPTLAPVVYPLLGHAKGFFDSTATFAGVAPYASLATPYTIAPFTGAPTSGTKAFGALAVPLTGFTNTSSAATTGSGCHQSNRRHRGGFVRNRCQRGRNAGQYSVRRFGRCRRQDPHDSAVSLRRKHRRQIERAACEPPFLFCSAAQMDGVNISPSISAGAVAGCWYAFCHRPFCAARRRNSRRIQRRRSRVRPCARARPNPNALKRSCTLRVRSCIPACMRFRAMRVRVMRSRRPAALRTMRISLR